MSKVLVIAGGSGGHIFPALAVAKKLQQAGHDIVWLGSNAGLEKKLVSPHFPVEYIDIDRLRGKGIKRKIAAPFAVTKAVAQARKVIKRIKPQAVLAMGGFVAGPGGLAAFLSGIPLIIHEQNSIAGMTNKILSRFSKKVLTGFPHVFPKRTDAMMIGNPVREDIINTEKPEQRWQQHDNALRILVLGGSQGAKPLNETLPLLWQQLPENIPLEIWHQAGERTFEQTKAAYNSVKVPFRLEQFIDDMPKAYSWADIIICRSGALTVAELAAVGVPSILVPFPQAVDNHQFYNAKYLADANAAVLLPQNELTVARLQEILLGYKDNRAELLAMANRARALAKPQATQAVVDAMNEYL